MFTQFPLPCSCSDLHFITSDEMCIHGLSLQLLLRLHENKWLEFESSSCFHLNCFSMILKVEQALWPQGSWKPLSTDLLFVISPIISGKVHPLHRQFNWLLIWQPCQGGTPTGEVREMTSAFLPVVSSPDVWGRGGRCHHRDGVGSYSENGFRSDSPQRVTSVYCHRRWRHREDHIW